MLINCDPFCSKVVSPKLTPPFEAESIYESWYCRLERIKFVFQLAKASYLHADIVAGSAMCSFYLQVIGMILHELTRSSQNGRGLSA